jgi:hypothetical protein
LIWETLLAYARFTKGNIAFISKNRSDFATSKGNLHPDLAKDLIELGLPDDKIRYFPNQKEFLDTVIPGHTKCPDLHTRLTQALDEGTSLENVLLNMLDDASWLDSGYEALDTDGEADEVISISNLLFTNLIVDDEEEPIVEVSATAEIEFEYFIPKHDLAYLEEDHFIVDSNWNEYVALVHMIQIVDFEAYLTIDLAENKIQDADVVQSEISRRSQP